MIKSVELWNWESHEHTLVDNLSAGFNLIFGESNAGKTSIIRAIKLVAYNEFNPKCIRVGSKTCSVEIKTDKGRVKVTRPSNEWEVEKNGEPTQFFEKIGKVVLPEVSEILGMSMVRLGDAEFPVNVMNQLEGHFMLSELNGKTASGSVRAQIIDEISGLSGIEGLIKEVSLDNHRWGREIKKMEERVEELSSQKYDGIELQEESLLLDKVKQNLDKNEYYIVSAKVLTDLHKEALSEISCINDIESSLSGLPDEVTIDRFIENAVDNLEKVADARFLKSEWDTTSNLVQEIESTLIKELDIESILQSLSQASSSFDRLSRLRTLNSQYIECRGAVDLCLNNLAEIEDEIFDAKRELNGILSTITVCPLTQQAFSPGGCNAAIDSDVFLDDNQ